MVNSNCSDSSSVGHNSYISSTSNADFIGLKKKRSCTDLSFLVIFLLVLFLLFGLVFYCFKNGDVRIVYNGYDECGNICGFFNEISSNPDFCIGKVDVRDKKFLKMEAPFYAALDLVNVNRSCVSNCENTYQEISHRCIPKNLTNITSKKDYLFDINSFSSVVFQDLLQTRTEIIILCILAFILSHFVLCMLRFIVGIVVWFILIGVVVANFVAAIILWIYWHGENTNIPGKDKAEQNYKVIYLAFAIISSISTIIILLIMVAIRKRVALVVQLFKEAGRAIENMPTLLIQPVWTFFLLCIVVYVWSCNALYIESSGILSFEPNGTTNLYYEKKFTMKFTRIYNIFIFFWIIQFIMACQHMIVAGAVATWYFTRNKKDLSYPLLTYTRYLFKYHLGSAAFGSFIINVVKFLRHFIFFLSIICKKSEYKVLQIFHNAFQCLCGQLHTFLQYLTINAYIEISIYGDNFSKSGKRAFDIVTSSKLRISALNSVGDFVLIMIKILVVIMNTIFGYIMIQITYTGIRNIWVPLTIVGLFSYVIAHCFISVYEKLIDALFICFCEDCNLNDATQEYFMSKELMDFIVRNQKDKKDESRPVSFFIVS